MALLSLSLCPERKISPLYWLLLYWYSKNYLRCKNQAGKYLYHRDIVNLKFDAALHTQLYTN